MASAASCASAGSRPTAGTLLWRRRRVAKTHHSATSWWRKRAMPLKPVHTPLTIPSLFGLVFNGVWRAGSDSLIRPPCLFYKQRRISLPTLITELRLKSPFTLPKKVHRKAPLTLQTKTQNLIGRVIVGVTHDRVPRHDRPAHVLVHKSLAPLENLLGRRTRSVGGTCDRPSVRRRPSPSPSVTR